MSVLIDDLQICLSRRIMEFLAISMRRRISRSLPPLLSVLHVADGHTYTLKVAITTTEFHIIFLYIVLQRNIVRY